MPRVPNVPCAGGCGRILWSGSSSLPEGQATCRSCRRNPRRPLDPLGRCCRSCGERLLVGLSKYCSKQCALGGRRGPESECPVCGRTFKSWNAGRVGACCSRSCHSKQTNAARPRRGPDPHANKKRLAIKRARKLGAFVEAVDPNVVFERDRWRCHLCHQRVSSRAKWPDPRSASLDHVVPLSRGGEHSYANVATAHLGCNVSKGNRGGGEQLALIG